MIRDRPYRKRIEPELALEIIQRSAGSQFDPKVAAAFLKAWEAGHIQTLLESSKPGKQAPPLRPEDTDSDIPIGKLATVRIKFQLIKTQQGEPLLGPAPHCPESPLLYRLRLESQVTVEQP
jgi:hypothetical protein